MAQQQLPLTPTLNPVEKIQAILEAERKPAPEVREPPKEAQKEVQEPVGEAQPEPEAPPAENAQVEGAAVEDAPQLEIPEDQLEAIELEVTTKGEDGKDVIEKPTVKELKLGYMRQKDYQRKTAEVARQREEVGEKVRQAVESERKVYTENLQLMSNMILETAAQELKGVNWNDLAANDPAKYVQLRNRADQLTGALQVIRSKMSESEAKAKDESSQAIKRAAREADAKLESEMPGWTDTIKKSVVKAAESFGFKPDEIDTWVDPRAFKLLHAVYEYQQLKPAPAKDKKVVVPPKVVKPNASQPMPQQVREKLDAMKRLQSSGNLEDAAAVIRSRI